MSRRTLFRDIETRSALSLPDVGAHVYAAHPTTSVWCVAYAVDDGPVLLWWPGDPIPEPFIEAARNPDWLVVAHNDAFEREIEQQILAPQIGWPIVPIERHRCTMAMSLACSLPGKLEKVAAVLKLTAQKDKAGTALMRQMAKPRRAKKGEDPSVIHWHDAPDKIARLGAYCIRDVESERELYHRLTPLSDAEQSLWQLDAAINARGFFTDGALLDAAAKTAAAIKASMQTELSAITGGAVTSTTQLPKLRAWLAEHGCKIADAQKATLAAALRRKDIEPAARRAIELRQLGAADTKVATVISRRSADSRVRGVLQFHGAGTGRWAARGLQVQNFVRDDGTIDGKIASILAGECRDLETIAIAARGCIIAAPGHHFLIGDFSGVESRTLAWAARETAKLDQWRRFDETGDPRDEPYFILGKACGMPDERARQGKYVDLGFGYQGGIAAYAGTTYDGDPSTDAERETFKQIWRERHPQTVKFWRAADNCAIRAVRSPGTRHGTRISFKAAGDFLELTLPSSRVVRYPFPTIMRNRFGQNAVSFMDTALGKWAPCNFGQGAYGGLFVENIVQAIARDLLAAAMLRLEAAGYPIVLTVHDEIICEVPDGFGSLDEFHRLLVEAPAWAAGLPVAAKCRQAPRYSKPAKAKNGAAAAEASPAPAASVIPPPSPIGADIGANIEMGVSGQNPPFEPILPPEMPQNDDFEPVSPRSNGHDQGDRDQRDDAAPGAPAQPAGDFKSGGAPNGQGTSEAAGEAPGAPPWEGEPEPPPSKDDEPPPKGNGHDDQQRADDADYDSDGPDGQGHGERDTGRLVASYVYCHADGSRYLCVKKYINPKGFPQFHWSGAKWIKGAPAGLKIPYRLPELIKAPADAWVLICAGEKDAETAARLGFVATTNPEGERKGAWAPELNAWFAGRQRVAIMEDNDDAGQAHVIEVATALRGLVPDIRIVTFRDLPAHGDLTDWIEQDPKSHDAEALRARIAAAKAYYTRPRPAPIGNWDGQPVPAPEYVVANRIPAEQVFLFSGEGGEGKSIMLQQLCAAHAIGADWLDCDVRQGPAIWIECEDTERALHWRLDAIARHYGVSFKALADAGLQLFSMVDHDSILAATGKNGIVEPTAAYAWLHELAGDIKPVLIGIASTSNIFAGNENVRAEVQQFTKLLTRIALLTGGSVALVTHPSVSGVTSTTSSHEGLSGSTQWHNAVRGRAVMKSVKAPGDDTGPAPVNRIREIKFHKNQYGPPVASSFVRWQNGLFLPIAGATMDQAERATKAETIFVALLQKFTAQGQVVSHASGRNYAPARFAEHPDADGITNREFAHAMQRLLDAGAIEIRTGGRPSHPTHYLAVCGAAQQSEGDNKGKAPQ